MYLPMTHSRTNNIKWQYYEKNNIIAKPNFGIIQIINIMMYVTIFCKPLFTLGYYYIYPKNCDLSG